MVVFFYYSHMSFDNLHTSEQSSERSSEHQKLLVAFMDRIGKLEEIPSDTVNKLSKLSFAELQEVAQKSEIHQISLQKGLQVAGTKELNGF